MQLVVALVVGGLLALRDSSHGAGAESAELDRPRPRLRRENGRGVRHRDHLLLVSLDEGPNHEVANMGIGGRDVG